MEKIDLQFIKKLKLRSNKNISFIEEVASVLEINYDAAYRRVNGRTSISLDDAIKLSKHFKISLNSLFSANDDTINVNKTTDIKDFRTLENYYDLVNEKLKPIAFKKDVLMYYNAKELPVLHILKNTLLLRFKIYVWLQVLGKDNHVKKISFENFNIPNSLIESALNVGEMYRNVNVIEIWNVNIINTILHQIKYFFEVDLITAKNALIICQDLIKTIKNIEETSHLGKRSNPNKTDYQLYINPISNSNNNVLVKSPDYTVFFLSFSILRYYEFEDAEVCDNMERFYKEQLILSKQITKSGVKDIILFFKPLYLLIDDLIKQITLLKQFPIQKF